MVELDKVAVWTCGKLSKWKHSTRCYDFYHGGSDKRGSGINKGAWVQFPACVSERNRDRT